MRPHMYMKIPFKWKYFLTLAKLLWLFPNMSSHMTAKSIFMWNYFLTAGAFPWLFPSMSSHMTVKITLMCFFSLQWVHRYGFFPLWVLISLWRCLHLKKTFPTVGAFIWLLSRMSSNMNFKISLSVIILSHIWCINMASPQNGYSCEFQDYLSMKIYYHSCCTGMALSR